MLRRLDPWLLLATGAIFGLASPVLAQTPDDCDDDLVRGPLEIFPAFGSRDVRLDAPVRVRYSEGFFEDSSIGLRPEDAVFLDRLSGAPTRCPNLDAEIGEPVPADVVLVGDEVVLAPQVVLEPNTTYRAHASGELSDFDACFVTGNDVDVEAPRLPPISSFAAAEIGPSCDAPDGGYRIDITIPSATDDGPKGDVEYLLYLTRGPTIEAPILKERARGVTEDQIVMAFALPLEDVAGPICVAVRAVDGVGRMDEDERVRCEDPIQGNFFEPLCSAAMGRAARPGLSAWLLPIAAVVLVRRRRR